MLKREQQIKAITGTGMNEWKSNPWKSSAKNVIPAAISRRYFLLASSPSVWLLEDNTVSISLVLEMISDQFLFQTSL